MLTGGVEGGIEGSDLGVRNITHTMQELKPVVLIIGNLVHDLLVQGRVEDGKVLQVGPGHPGLHAFDTCGGKMDVLAQVLPWRMDEVEPEML